jgi:dTDP-4-dehydrorhamnose reductase
MRRVLVLGADGMLGQMVRRVLTASGELHAEGTTRRDRSDPLFLDAEADPQTWSRVLRQTAPFEYWINCIGVLSRHVSSDRPDSVRKAVAVNALFPNLLAEASVESGASVLHVSTDGVFAPGAGVCFEDTPISCTDPYGQTKALGEVDSPAVLNIRCSLIGPDPGGRKGLWAWLLGRPRNADIPGYTDHSWNGVTTLQFARLCEQLIRDDLFESVRAEGGTHHFCPNRVTSKYELLLQIRDALRPDLTITPGHGPGASVTRLLNTRRQSLPRLFGMDLPMQAAVRELAAFA